MDNNLFREKSIKRISSPEQLNDYIKVANPGVWVSIIAVIILMIGSFIWSFFFSVEEKFSTYVFAENGTMNAIVSEEEISGISAGMKVTINKKAYVIEEIPKRPTKIDDEFDEYLAHVSGVEYGDWIYIVKIQSSDGSVMEDGIYRADIVTNSFTPSSLFFN